MQRQIHSHILIPDCPAELNTHLSIMSMDEPDNSGARAGYVIQRKYGGASSRRSTLANLCFHQGPASEGLTVNGISNEALLAIVLDRMQAWESGPFKCPENAECVRLIEQALAAIRRRALARHDRGVLGTTTI